MCVFKIKKVEYTNKTFRIPTVLVKKLETLAQEQNVSLNSLIIQCCEYALQNIDCNDQPREEKIQL